MRIEDLFEGQRIEFIDDYHRQVIAVHEAYRRDKGEITYVGRRDSIIVDSHSCAWVKLDDGRFVYLTGELPVRVLNRTK
jgi:hypothetical protein